MDEQKTTGTAGRSGKAGVVIALVALVVVLVVAFLGYDALVGRAGSQAEPAGAPGASTGAAGSSDAKYLSDYEAVVYSETGEPFTFDQIAGGKPLVINFWATWCPYCVQEMPDFQDIYAQYGDKVSFAFVDYADGSRETVEDASAWLADNGFDDLPAYYDTKIEAVQAFGIAAFPTTVVVAADGEVMTITRGAIDPDLMRGALATLV